LAPQTKPSASAPPEGIRYPVSRPCLPDLESLRDELSFLWKAGRITAGDRVRALEEAFVGELGVGYAVAVSSGTSGLILAGHALGITGEVIVPAFTFGAAAHAVTWNRATPVFCDSEPGTLTLDPRKIEKKITRKTSAVMPVAIFGVPPRVGEFARLAEKHGLHLVYDSAQALGAKVDGRSVGGFGDAEVFSLGTAGVVTAVEGGMVTTNDGVLAKRIRQMRDYGKADDGYDMAYVGLSARMSELHAAVGLAEFGRIGDRIRHRGELVSLYRKRLEGLPGVRFQEVPEGVSPSYASMVIFLDRAGALTRGDLHRRLMDEGIETKYRFYPAVHKMMAYRRWSRRYPGKLTVAEKAAREGLALPLYGDLREEDVDFICSRVRAAFAAA